MESVTPMPEQMMRELRCPKCHGLLLKEYIFKGRLSIKCWHTDPATRKKCGEMVSAVFKDHRDLPKNPNGKIKTVQSST